MFRALRECEEAKMAHAPAAKDFHRRGKKLLRDILIPKRRVHRQRAEKTEAAPMSREIRADEFPIAFGSEHGRWIGLPARSSMFDASGPTRILR